MTDDRGAPAAVEGPDIAPFHGLDLGLKVTASSHRLTRVAKTRTRENNQSSEDCILHGYHLLQIIRIAGTHQLHSLTRQSSRNL